MDRAEQDGSGDAVTSPLISMPARASISIMRRKKNPAAVALAKLGAKKGGKARMKQLTPAERSELARKAANARWGAHK
jgi:hypothetical protein